MTQTIAKVWITYINVLAIRKKHANMFKVTSIKPASTQEIITACKQ